MNPRSAKNKGNRYENHLIKVLREKLDSKAQRTYGSGAGLDKQDIRLPSFNIEIEAKNQKTLKVMDWWEQCKRQAFGNIGVMIFRNPRKPEFQESLVIMDLYDWIELVKSQNEVVEVESNYDPKLKYKIANLKRAVQDVFKELT